MKKFIALVITLAMCISLLPTFSITAAALTSGDFEYTVSNDEVTITGYKGSATEIEVPSTIGGYPVTAIGDNAFAYCYKLTSLTIPAKVTTIGDKAFYYSYKLKNVTIPAGVTSIGSQVFSYCTSLTSIDTDINNPNYASVDGVLFNKNKTKLIAYPAGKTASECIIPSSVTTIGDNAFWDSASLTSVMIPDGVTTIGNHAFFSCDNLASVAIPASITAIGLQAFDYCKKLADVHYGGTEDEWKAITVGSHNEYLTNANIHFKPEIPEGLVYKVSNGEVTITDYTGSATELVIPSTIEGYPVTAIGNDAFYNCSNLTSVIIPDGVTTIGNYAFLGCASLESVEIPSGVTTIGSYAFYNCTSLVSVTIPASVTTIGVQSLYGCTSLVSIDADASNQNYASVEGVLFNKDKTEIVAYPAGKSVSEYTIPDGVTTIGNSAFYCCGSLASVIIPDGVTTIGVQSFANCTSLTSVTIPVSVKTIEYFAFDGCEKLADVYYGGTEIQWNAISIGYYNECLTNANIHFATVETESVSLDKCEISLLAGETEKLTATVLPEYATDKSVTFASSNDEVAIVDETGVVAAVMDGTATITVTTVDGGHTATCTVKVTHVCADNDKDYKCDICGERVGEPVNFTYAISKGKVTITGYTGSDKEVVVPSTIDGYPVTAIGDDAFYGLTEITSVIIPDGVTAVGARAFEYCENLKSVIMPDGVKNIGEYAFDCCYNLMSVTIPDSVTFIGRSAFYECVSLEQIDLPESLTAIEDCTFYACSNLSSVTIVNSVETIGGLAFESCTSLVSVTIGNNVKTIGDRAFYNCMSIERINVPDSVMSIGNATFDLCYSVNDVYYDGTEEQWNAISIGYYNECLTNANIHFTTVETENVTISTEAKAFARQETSFTYTVSLAGTYDGYSFEIVPVGGLTIEGITAESDDINVDEKGDGWLVSVLGGMEKVDSEKKTIVSVFVVVDADAEVGPRELSLSNVFVTDEYGDRIKDISYEYATIQITDRLQGDINVDGVFNYLDVAKLYAFYQEKVTLDEFVEVDINKDGVFDYLDIAKLYAIYRGKVAFI